MKIAIQAHPRASTSERGKPIHDEKPDRLGQPCDMNAFRRASATSCGLGTASRSSVGDPAPSRLRDGAACRSRPASLALEHARPTRSPSTGQTCAQLLLSRLR